MRRPTLEDVARLAGVSRSTVSRVITRQPGVAPRIRRLVPGGHRRTRLPAASRRPARSRPAGRTPSTW
ncbi:LacI family DNA-binding transcriptional regulator [Kutzneria kofuensis]|uniref:LacI family DNA-binding transcriptional regulator n=1 Tax=Kutzneria kofuensis TaxID=103725 RepID=UPI003CD09DA0